MIEEQKSASTLCSLLNNHEETEDVSTRLIMPSHWFLLQISPNEVHIRGILASGDCMSDTNLPATPVTVA